MIFFLIYFFFWLFHHKLVVVVVVVCFFGCFRGFEAMVRRNNDLLIERKMWFRRVWVMSKMSRVWVMSEITRVQRLGISLRRQGSVMSVASENSNCCARTATCGHGQPLHTSTYGMVLRGVGAC